MATNRRLRRPPPPPPSPPEDDVHSSEESAGEDQLDQHQSFSNDDGSDSEQVQTTPVPLHSSAAPATIHPPPVAIHPAPSTGSDDDEEDDSGDDGSESDQEQITPNQPHSPAAPATTSDDQDSDDGDDSEEEDSESEAEPSSPLPPPSAAVARTVPVPAFASDNDDITGAESGQDELEIEKEQSGGGETSKKLFERVWSDEDQITLLMGIIDYTGSHQGKNPMAKTEDLWLFLKEKLSCRVTKKQLIRKIRQVKAKYVKNQKRKRPFNTPYDAEVFKLSEKLWEETLLGENGGSKKRKSEEMEESGAEDEVFDEDEIKWEDYIVSLSMNHMSWTEESARAKIKSLDGYVRKLMVQDWKILTKEQVRCISIRLSLKRESMATIFGQRS